MSFSEEIVYTKPYYKWIHKETVETIKAYYKFINWVSGEFDLWLQEDELGLKVYVSNGCISIHQISDEEDSLNIKIVIVHKSKEQCKKMIQQIMLLYSHLLKLIQLT